CLSLINHNVFAPPATIPPGVFFYLSPTLSGPLRWRGSKLDINVLTVVCYNCHVSPLQRSGRRGDGGEVLNKERKSGFENI
ncbi:MAG: hypothetical protein AAGA62_09030, partial [Bacteroidota bacterium]